MCDNPPFIDCFFHQLETSISESIKQEIVRCHGVNGIYQRDNLYSSDTLQDIFNHSAMPYVLLCYATEPLTLADGALQRMVQVMEATGAAMVYSDYRCVVDGQMMDHPVINCCSGSVRNDFDFGKLILFQREAVLEEIDEMDHLQYAAFYHLHLRLLRTMHVEHISEYLYTVGSKDRRSSGEQQFDYLDPRNRAVQKEMECVFTRYAVNEGFDVAPAMRRKLADLTDVSTLSGATVIIPVRNRVATIADAIHSALQQQCAFDMNIIVVDNHSTDGTTDVIASLAAIHPQLIHVIPERTDLGIGGCWNLAMAHPQCHDIVIQLDSDDLYSSPHTVSCIMEVFRKGVAVMVIGSYRMVDFNLQEIAPGVIDHREWTDANGANNALRINGLGAPRAFFKPAAGAIGFPNVSYGEDYAMVLAMSGAYEVERIYDVLYLCRRWGGNSDAQLTQVQINRNNAYKDKLRSYEIGKRRMMDIDIEGKGLNLLFDWQMQHSPQFAQNYADFHQHTGKRKMENGAVLQLNAARIHSATANVDRKAPNNAPCNCPLCFANRPADQAAYVYGGLVALVNPYPLAAKHFTLALKNHTSHFGEQEIASLMQYLCFFPDYTFIYNGPSCGASIPNHTHFQALWGKELPLIKEVRRQMGESELLDGNTYDGCSCHYIETLSYAQMPLFVLRLGAFPLFQHEPLLHIIRALPCVEGETLPRFNLVAWQENKDDHFIAVIPRAKHRPNCYYSNDDTQRLVSPGAMDMAGLVVTVREEDYQKLDAAAISSILREVSGATLDMNAIRSAVQKNFCHKANSACGDMEY